MKRLQIRTVVMSNRVLDRFDAIEIVIREAMKQARLMARLDMQSLSDTHDQGAEQVDGDDMPLLRFMHQRLDDFAFDQAEYHQGPGVLRLSDHPPNLGSRARVAKDAQPPAISELNHRRAYRGASGLPGPIGDHEDGHVIG